MNLQLRGLWLLALTSVLVCVIHRTKAELPVVGPLKVDEGARHLSKADGTHFGFAADTPWQLLNDLKFEQAVEFISIRIAQGFTTLQMTCLPWIPNDVNAYGQKPFVCDNCYTAPNEAFWSHVDAVLQHMESVGMVAYLVVMWADGYSAAVSEQDHYNMGHFVGSRWKGLTNIIWVLGGDNLCCTNKVKFEQMFEGIRDAGRHPASTGRGGLDILQHPDFVRRSGLSQCATKTSSAAGAAPVLVVWLTRYAYTSTNKPIVLVETYYEKSQNIDAGDWDSLHLPDSAQFRSFPWAARVSGSFGEGYGAWMIWLEAKDGVWQNDINLPGAIHIAQQMRTILHFVDETTLVPENDGSWNAPAPIIGGSCDYPLGTSHWSGKNPSCIFSSISHEQKQAIVYFDPLRDGQYNCATINTAFFPSGATAVWWDPVSELPFSAISLADGQIQTVCPPGASSEADWPGEWVLLVNPSGKLPDTIYMTVSVGEAYMPACGWVRSMGFRRSIQPPNDDVSSTFFTATQSNFIQGVFVRGKERQSVSLPAAMHPALWDERPRHHLRHKWIWRRRKTSPPGPNARTIAVVNQTYGCQAWTDVCSQILYGMDGKDYLFGGTGRDSLWGGAGKDRLFGNQGKDTLMGGMNKDRLYGGHGKDGMFLYKLLVPAKETDGRGAPCRHLVQMRPVMCNGLRSGRRCKAAERLFPDDRHVASRLCYNLRHLPRVSVPTRYYILHVSMAHLSVCSRIPIQLSSTSLSRAGLGCSPFCRFQTPDYGRCRLPYP
eukprot:scaffold1093_cov359-Prasinococcus_capsulatus_cf.AAC.18